MDIPKPHIALFPSPGMGHLIPILELGKHLVTLHGFHATIFVTTNNSSTAQSQLLSSLTLPGRLTIVHLPPADISGLVHADTAMETRVSIIVRESVPALRSAILTMISRPNILIVDIFGTDAFELADHLEIPKYVLITPTALFLALTIYVPTLDLEVVGEYVHLQEPIRIPGCKPIRPADVVDPMLDRNSERYNVYVRMGSGFPKAHGLFMNTWEDLEPTTIRALRQDPTLQRILTLPIYPIGPLTRAIDPQRARSECLDWLHKQPTESVLYVSFGSGGTMSAEQLTELACGLELSQQRFIWVVRPPTRKDPSGTFFTAGNGCEDPLEYLPDGFLTRTHNVGMVVPNWAPQVEILSHPSTGGFLSHCGWNSTLESIRNGVPMIAWPLYAEQRMNASMLTEDLRVAVRPEKLPTKEVVRREEIERMVRLIMEEGNAIRAAVKELQRSAQKALNKGGSSYNSLSEVAREWEMSVQRKKFTKIDS